MQTTTNSSSYKQGEATLLRFDLITSIVSQLANDEEKKPFFAIT
jgi:hypothetical protein